MASFAAEETQDRRDILLKAITIGVLLASTGVAWVFVLARSSVSDRAKTAMVDSAAQAVVQIRNQGLDTHWGAETRLREEWYLLYSERGLAGWRAVIRWREADGTHKGLQLLWPQRRWEYWQLNDEGTAGRYEAGEVSTIPGSPHLAKKTTTKIFLKQGRVELHQPAGVSQADVPRNYVPEGMLELACFVAAVRGTDAHFSLILNDDPPDGQVTRFGSATLSDIKAVRRGLAATVTISSADGGGGKRTLLFNRAGLLLGTTVGPTEERLVARDTVVRIFRSAPGQVADVLRGVTAPATSRPGPTTTSAPATRPKPRPE